MKKFKIVLFILVIAALAVLVIGNFDFFSTRHSLQINLFNRFVYTFPAIFNGLYLLGCFLIGILLALYMTLMFRFRTHKELKLLKEKVSSQMDRIASLKKEVEFLQRNNSQTVTQSRESDADNMDGTVTQS